MDIHSFRNRLDGLDALLRAENMLCGPDIWQLVFMLLKRLEQQNRLPDDAHQLAPLLGPLFCRNPEDQARFRVLFKQWLSDDVATIGSVNRVIVPQHATIAAARTWAQKVSRRWFAGMSALIVMLIAVFIVQVTNQPPHELPEPAPLPDNVSQSNDPVVITPKEPSSVPIIDRVDPRPQPKPNELSEYWKNILQNIERILFWLPLSLALLWLAKRYHQCWILNSQSSSGEDLLNHFRFERVLTPIFGGAKTERALRDLRAAQFQPTRHLDVVATVEATARGGDYFQPIYRNRRTTPEHLLLVRSLHRNDQQAALAEELVEQFRTLGLQVQTYRFRDDPRWLVRWNDEGGDYHQLAQLVARHGNARLLVISETNILSHPYSGDVRPWLNDFTPWQDNIWLHPRDAGPVHATLLAQHNFLLLPLSQDSLPQLVARLTATQPAITTPQPTQTLLLPEFIATEPDAWLGENPPYGANLSELIRQLERFLGTYGLRLLRAVAVYPKPHWQLTLALDYLLFSHLNTAINTIDPTERREQRLSRLSRLPWLTQVHLPDWLREYLLVGMDKSERLKITTAWQRLFSQLTNKEGFGTLSLEIRTPSKRQLQVRLADFRAMKKSDSFDDPIFANILLGGKLGLLDFRLPQALTKLLPSASKWLILRPALTTFLCAAISVWGLNAVWSNYGEQALIEFQQKQIAAENTQWHITLNYQPDTEMLATSLQKTLQTSKFSTTTQSDAVEPDSDTNRIHYPTGGEIVAQRVAQTLSWLSYGAQVQLSESPTLATNTIQIQLSQTYQHLAGFDDELRYPYQERLPFEPEMVLIQPGSFLMGSSKIESGRAITNVPQHEVNIAYPFEIGKYEVTFAEYDAFAKATNRPLPLDGESSAREKYINWGAREINPVINVSFIDAQAYVQWLSKETGKSYRLPTEAEWEYAARAGSQTIYWWGDDIGENNAICNRCGSPEDSKQTAPVGSFKSNSFGLHDTAGNVWELTQDCWHNNYQNAPADGSAWLEADGGNCNRRVVRGGSWESNSQDLRSATRNWNNAVLGEIDLGFRVARDL